MQKKDAKFVAKLIPALKTKKILRACEENAFI